MEGGWVFNSFVGIVIPVVTFTPMSRRNRSNLGTSFFVMRERRESIAKAWFLVIMNLLHEVHFIEVDSNVIREW